MKRITILLLSLFTFSAQAADVNDKSCFIQGKVNLPLKTLGQDSIVTVYNQTSKIYEDGTYCITNKVKNREHYYLYVSKNNKILLKNIFFDKNKKKNFFNIDLKTAISEYLCEDRLCNENEIKNFSNNHYVKEYSNKIRSKYYESLSSNFSYEKIEKKMKKQKRKAKHSSKKELKVAQKKDFFPLSNIESKNYNNFKFKEKDINKNKKDFLANQDILKGLSNSTLSVNTIVSNWVRYLYYYGDDLSFSGALYSSEFKDNLNNILKIEDVLKFSTVYQIKVKNASKIRANVDKNAYKRTLKKIDGLFNLSNKNISNQKPDYVDIQFIYINGAWRLDSFSVNKQYYNYIKSI